MHEMIPQKRARGALLAIGAGLAVFALSFGLPYHLLLPIGLAALGMAVHPLAAVVAALVGGGLCFAFKGAEAAAAFIMFMPGGIMPLLVLRRESALTSVFVTATLTLAALWCGMVFFAAPINAYFAQTKANILAWFAMAIENDMLRAYFGADSLMLWRSAQLLLLDTAREILGGAVLAYSMISALLSYIICRAIAKKRGIQAAKFPRFAQWSLPDGFGFGTVILSTASFMVEGAYGLEYASLAFMLRVVVFLPFTVLGMCSLEYYLAQKRVHAALRILLNAILALFLSLVLTFFGVFEYAFALRKRTKLRTK